MVIKYEELNLLKMRTDILYRKTNPNDLGLVVDRLRYVDTRLGEFRRTYASEINTLWNIINELLRRISILESKVDGDYENLE